MLCLEECAAGDRCVLHGEQHWTCRPCLKKVADGTHARPLLCPVCRDELAEERVQSLLGPVAEGGASMGQLPPPHRGPKPAAGSEECQVEGLADREEGGGALCRRGVVCGDWARFLGRGGQAPDRVRRPHNAQWHNIEQDEADGLLRWLG